MGHTGRVGRRGRGRSAECTGRTSGSALTGERRGPATSSGRGGGRSRPRRPGGGSDRAGQRRARSGVVGRARRPVSSLNLPPAGQPPSCPFPPSTGRWRACLSPSRARLRGAPRGEPIVVGEGDAVEECLVEGPSSATCVLTREAVGDGHSDLKGLAVLTCAPAARVPISVRPSMQAWGGWSPWQVLPARWRGVRARPGPVSPSPGASCLSGSGLPRSSWHQLEAARPEARTRVCGGGGEGVRAHGGGGSVGGGRR